MMERRKHKRIAITVPAVATDGQRIGRVTDVSMGGMAILHEGTEPWPSDLKEIDLQIEPHRFRLPITILWDRAQTGEEQEPARMCGVQFKELEQLQLYKLEYFIWSQTSGWPEIPFPLDESGL
jgi:c-di-GMP-binding flagellar brake protein YcgR